MAILADASGASLAAFAKATTVEGAIVHTDGWRGYLGLSAAGYEHRRHRQQATPVGEQLLPRAHRAVSNLKAWLHGTHRSVSTEHLLVYLDEFVFRHNRRSTRWLTSRHSSASAPCTTPRPIDRSPLTTEQPEQTGYALELHNGRPVPLPRTPLAQALARSRPVGNGLLTES